MTATWIILIVLAYILGMFHMHMATKPREPINEKSPEKLIERVKPSFSNPMRTTQKKYERYISDEGLYSPTKPKKAVRNDEIEI